jgi:hypothetical protein
MLDTCFFFLISDYLVADGSFRNALARVLAGASGVFAGNFQIIQEDAAPEFYENFEQDAPALTITPRELMSWALDHLHPMTTGNMVNFTMSHTAHTNRLFWRVDQDTLIGRFYLMHMICIRPEVADFVIGSSCDYSFIPEMCPSGSIEALTDSDEYLVVEMQPRDHERAFLRMGPFYPDALAETLSEWTTARHRENAGWTLVFHAKDVPDTLPAVRAEADHFVALVGAKLSSSPQPHRDHPYWLGAIAAHRWSLKRMRRDDVGFASLPGESGMEPGTRHPGVEDPCFWPPALCPSLASALARLSRAPGSAAEAAVREPGESDGGGPERPFPEGLDFTVCGRREAFPDGRSSAARSWAISRSAQELSWFRRLARRPRASSLPRLDPAYLSAPDRRRVSAAGRHQWPSQCIE